MDFRAALCAWGRHSHICNMHVERLLSLIRRSCANMKPLPLERLTSNGFLAQFLAAHRAAGGADPRAWTTEQMVAEGVPLIGAEERRRKQRETRGGVQPRMLFARTLPRPQVKDAASARRVYDKWRSDAAKAFVA